MDVSRLRRMPYIEIKDNVLSYRCPVCRNVIPRNEFKNSSTCPSCKSHINKVAKRIINTYYMYDPEMYYFILSTKGGENK